jgi:ABC-type multidrug transport system fused ATPase/permease subunit
MSVKNELGKVLSILSDGDRRQFYWLIVVMLIMGVLEVAGIGSIMPFIAAVSNIDGVLENRHARHLYDLLGLRSKESFIIFLGGSVLALLVVRGVFFAVANWLVFRFTFMWRHNLSERLLSKYLMQPYAYFLSQNTLELKRNVCNETERLVNGVIIPGIQVLTGAIISACITILLFAINPHIAVLVAASLGGSYLALYGFVYRKLSRLSKRASEMRRAQFKIAGEAFEGIKELKLFGKEYVFVAGYSGLSHKNAVLETRSRVISQLPRYGIEMLAVSSILIFILHLVGTGQDLSTWMPILVVYAVAGYRMLPALQHVFSSLTTIRFNISTLDRLHADFSCLSTGTAKEPGVAGGEREFGRIESIALRDIDFRYPGGGDYAIHKLNLVIEKNTTVGLVGPTGSGKTTVVDIILGLLRPLAGELAVNNVGVTADQVRRWQKHIGYVPQHIYLFDDTVARNIAFGIPDEQIDRAALENAARLANLHDYITNSLPDGYATLLGQRGIRLSGGQRQRVGIARALYHNPDVLVLDEATSALDGVTESVVMDAIQRVSHRLTIIMIAHRLNTVKNCDVIHYIDEGRLVASGTYVDLAVSCEKFQKMVNL